MNVLRLISQLIGIETLRLTTFTNLLIICNLYYEIDYLYHQ